LQAQELQKRTGCTAPMLKQWVRGGVIIPKAKGRGAGIHAKYDEANLISLAIALAMKESLAIVVSKYSVGFSELHHWLRHHSMLEWDQYKLLLQPHEATILHSRERFNSLSIGIVIDLSKFVGLVTSSVPELQPQIPLLALEAIK